MERMGPDIDIDIVKLRLKRINEEEMREIQSLIEILKLDERGNCIC